MIDPDILAAFDNLQVILEHANARLDQLLANPPSGATRAELLAIVEPLTEKVQAMDDRLTQATGG